MLSLLILFGLMTSVAHADGVAPRKFGLGLSLGEPLGVNARYYFADRFSGDLTVGYGFGEESFVIMPNALFHFRDMLEIKGDSFSVVPYMGVGLKTGVDIAGANDGDFVFAAKLPLGATLILEDGQIEIAAEFSPGIEFSPDTEFDPTGAIIVRYFFW